MDRIHAGPFHGQYLELPAAVRRLGSAGCGGGQLLRGHAQRPDLYGVFRIFHRAFCENCRRSRQTGRCGILWGASRKNRGKVPEDFFPGRRYNDGADTDGAYRGSVFRPGTGGVPGADREAAGGTSEKRRRTSGNRVCGNALFLSCAQ